MKYTSFLAAALFLAVTMPTQSAQAETQEVIVNVPDLTILGVPEPESVTIDVPDLIIWGKPAPEEITIDVPDLIIVGTPPPEQVMITVPDLVIVGGSQDDPLDRELYMSATDRAGQPDGSGSTTSDVATDAAIQDWCHGNYTSHVGRGVGTAVGFVMPFGQNLVSPAEVEVLACADALAVTVQGQRLTLGRIPDTRQYSGSIDLDDGPTRTLVLTCDEDLNLRGQLIAADANLSIERPVWMLRDTPGAFNAGDCTLP